MKRQVTVNGRSGRMEIDGSRLRYTREDGVEIARAYSVEQTGPTEFSILLDGRSYRVSAGEGGQVWVNGSLLSMEVFDPRDLRPGSQGSASQGRQQVAALMPGKVIRVLVAAGDPVKEGQGLIVVEAMKMQNEMKSPKSGRVAEVRARPDATVAAGEVLVVVE